MASSWARLPRPGLGTDILPTSGISPSPKPPATQQQTPHPSKRTLIAVLAQFLSSGAGIALSAVEATTLSAATPTSRTDIARGLLLLGASAIGATSAGVHVGVGARRGGGGGGRRRNCYLRACVALLERLGVVAWAGAVAVTCVVISQAGIVSSRGGLGREELLRLGGLVACVAGL